jgi:hypothetical protein
VLGEGCSSVIKLAKDGAKEVALKIVKSDDEALINLLSKEFGLLK